jgi:tetratricopeptide (TPR) repeat protein
VYLKDGQAEAAETEYKRILKDAPRHVEAHIGLGEVYTVMDDEDDDLYELAVEHFSNAIRLAESGTGSKRLTDGEFAGVLYSRGYARTALYEAAGVAGLDRLLGKAEKDFKDCIRKDPSHHKARRALAKVQRRRRPRSAEWIGDKLGPGIVLLLSVIVFALTQTSVIWSRPIENLDTTHYTLLTFGTLVFVVAGLYLPRLSSLRVGGIGLEKSVVDQISTMSSLGIRK